MGMADRGLRGAPSVWPTADQQTSVSVMISNDNRLLCCHCLARSGCNLARLRHGMLPVCSSTVWLVV